MSAWPDSLRPENVAFGFHLHAVQLGPQSPVVPMWLWCVVWLVMAAIGIAFWATACELICRSFAARRWLGAAAIAVPCLTLIVWALASDAVRPQLMVPAWSLGSTGTTEVR